MDFGSFCLYGLFWEFLYRSFSVFGLFSYSFLPLSASFVYRPFCLSPWVHLFHSMVSWSVLFVFLVMFFSYFLVLLEKFFVRWNYRQLLVGSKQQGFRISCVVVLFFIFLRGFMILSSSVLDSLSLLSCKNSVLLWLKWCSSTISN